MRLSLAVPILAGLLFGWAAVAQADAPPAAPIFYCPTPGKADSAATPAKPAAAHAGIRAHAHRHQGCPTVRVAAEHHRRHGPRAAATIVFSMERAPLQRPAHADVSASQAFIYRYERALHGLDARAADQAWAEGRHPPCPHVCPGPEGWRHDGRSDDHDYAQSAPLPPVEQRPAPAPVAPQAPPPSINTYAWQGDHAGDRYGERDAQSERAGGWRYAEIDGHGNYEHWGDHFDGEPGWRDRDDGRQDDGRGERHSAGPRYRCPPPVPASSCAAGAAAPVRHSDVAVAGRDAAGYLTWPGKTE
jgi:hypothetical protein